jgi:hypothetical protein
MRNWWRKRRRRGPGYLYVSYHKCATRFTERVLRSVCDRHGLRAEKFDSLHSEVTQADLAETDFLMLTDYSSAMVDLDRFSARGLYVTRDPRDILVSLYFSHRFSHELNHPEIERDRTALAGLAVPEGLDYLMRNSGFFARIMREMRNWPQARSGYFETTFERLTKQPQREFGRILSFLGLSVGERALSSILEQNSFPALQADWAREFPGAPMNHYRRGTAGDWRLHLVGECKERFRAQYGPLLIRLGFERQLDW